MLTPPPNFKFSHITDGQERPLFIPLKKHWFEAFEARVKKVEYRPYGARWNEKTCRIGRPVTLSCGYGKARRLHGIIAGFYKSDLPTYTDAWLMCYGDRKGDAACIEIELEAVPTSGEGERG